MTLLHPVLLTANEVMNTVTSGTYPIRPVLFAGYLLILVVAVYGLHWLAITVKPQWNRVMALIAVLSVSIVFLLNLGMQMYLFSQFGISQSSYAVAIEDDEITSTRLIHTHVGKTVIASLLGHSSGRVVLQADTGGALLPFIPAALIWIEIVLFLIAIGASVAASALRIFTMSGRTRVVGVVLFGLLGFLVLEKSVDGGIISDGAGLALATWACLMTVPLRRCLRVFPYLVIGYVWILLLMYAFGFYDSSAYITSALERTGILALLIGAALCQLSGKKKSAWLASAVAIVSISLCVYQNGIAERRYAATQITSGMQYLSVFDAEAQPALPIVSAVGNLKVYDASTLSPHTIGEILASYGLPAAYHPITNGAYTCASPSLLSEEKFSVVTRSRLTSVSSHDGLFSIEVQPEYPAPEGWYRYRGVILFNPCISRNLDVLKESLLWGGSSSALVYDFQRYLTPYRPL